MSLATFHTLTVKQIIEEVKGVKIFRFHEHLPYQSGQYLTLVHPADYSIRRSYSITSAPVLEEDLSIGVKRMENGIFSRWLIDRVAVGDTIVTTGAAGFFTLPEDIEQYTQIFFFAAGNGITPIYSLLKTAVYRYLHLSVTLIYSNHSLQESMFYTALTRLQSQFPDTLQIEFIFSSDKDIYRAHLHKDLLYSFLDRYAKHTWEETLFYICGPENYMRMCTYALQEMRVPANHIKKEDFSIRPPAVKAAPPDTEKHTVTITLHDGAVPLAVQYPTTILQAAKKNNIPLPYSCETGRCGSCALKCISGNVWMANNEVLTDRELQEGLVLTCVGYPVGGDVVLSPYE